MQIDWLTVAAQIVNFLVLVWLLQRFLYGPISRAMERREARIRQRLDDARIAHEDAEAEAQRLRDRQEALEQGRQAEMERARQAARDLRASLEKKIREDMGQKQAAWLEHLDEERAELVKDLDKRFARFATDTVGEMLSEFANTDIGDQVVAGFSDRLAAISREEKKALAEAAGGLDEDALVETATTLSSAARGRLTRAIHRELVDGIAVDYRQAPDLVIGVRLTIGGHTLEWSAASYLDRFQERVGEALDAAVAEGRTPGGGVRHD